MCNNHPTAEKLDWICVITGKNLRGRVTVKNVIIANLIASFVKIFFFNMHFLYLLSIDTLNVNDVISKFTFAFFITSVLYGT